MTTRVIKVAPTITRVIRTGSNSIRVIRLTARELPTGGLTGQRIKLTAISATQWAVTGVLFGSGTLATPFATS